MKTVFKEGDKVYCAVNGHGIVEKIVCDNKYPVRVEFENDAPDQYSSDGRLYDNSLPTLSFTEYTLQGFSQERQIELPEVGDLCLVRDHDDEYWRGVKFKTYDKTSNYPFIDSNDDGWKQMKRIKILD